MKLNVHLLSRPNEKTMAFLQADLHPDLQLTFGEELPENNDIHILVGGRPRQEQIKSCPNMHTLIIPWAGLPEETRELMAKYPQIAVHNLHHNADPVAELAFALLLSAAKFIIPLDRSLRQNDWTPRYQSSPTILLTGKTALVLGYGAIGKRVGRMCQDFGMKVLAVKRNLNDDAFDGGIMVYNSKKLEELLPQANVLIICLPLTPETKGLINARALELLPAGAILVNIGRGSIIEEEALYDALQARKLHAAGLDVWYNYPEDVESRSNTPPANYPFHELDNIVMSPHRAGASDETDRLRMTHLAGLLNAAVREEPLPNKVDLQAGY